MDASDRGLRIQCEAPLAPLTTVKLKLVKDNGYTETEARVAWSDGEGHIGIEFLDQSPRCRSELQVWFAALDRTETQCASETFSDDAIAVERSLDPILSSAAARAMLLTRAHGVAIALDDGRGMCCRVSAGDVAPPVGSVIDCRSGLTGACLRSGFVMWCNNAVSDAWVDRESCLKLGISSVIAVPVSRGGRVIGLIEVFSRQSNAFDASDCHGLETIARAVAGSVSGGWVVGPSHNNQSAERTGVGLRATVAETASESSTTETDDHRPISASTLLPTGYKFSLREKIILHQRAILWSAGVAMLAAGLWLGMGISRQFRNTPARKTAANSQIPELGASPKANQAVSVSASTISPTARWLEEVRQRAERGNSDAELKLGAAYANGQTGGENYNESVKWLTRSAEHGNVIAAAVLGAFDWAGRGGTHGYVDAYMWSAIAQAEGDEASSYRVSILESRMSPVELAEAKRRATDWLRAHHQPSVKHDVPAHH